MVTKERKRKARIAAARRREIAATPKPKPIRILDHPLYPQPLGWLLRPVKLPGWALVLLGAVFFVLFSVPSISGAFEFWTSQAKYFGPAMLIAGGLIHNPLFGPGIFVLGVLYLVFVGEAQYPLRSRIWVGLGWGLAAVVFLAAYTDFTVGYVASQLSPVRALTSAQKNVITKEAAILAPDFAVAEGGKALTVMSVDTPEASQYASEIMKAIDDGGLHVQGAANGLYSAPELHVIDLTARGVFMDVEYPDEPPPMAKNIVKILNDAGIKVKYHKDLDFGPGNFMISVGLA